MLELARHPECRATENGLVMVRLDFQGERESGIAAVGGRGRGFAEIREGVAIMPPHTVLVRLPERLFRHGEIVELAVKEHGFPSEEPPIWEHMDWSWSGVFVADVVQEQPVLRSVDAAVMQFLNTYELCPAI